MSALPGPAEQTEGGAQQCRGQARQEGKDIEARVLRVEAASTSERIAAADKQWDAYAMSEDQGQEEEPEEDVEILETEEDKKKRKHIQTLQKTINDLEDAGPLEQAEMLKT